MESEQKQKKILFAGLTILVLAGVFLYSASLLDRNTPVIQSVEPQLLMPTETEPEMETVVEPARVSTLDWKKVQFDACGGKDKYSSLPWWEKLDAHVQKLDYYSESYIQSALKMATEDKYNNPSGELYTYESYCRNSDQSPMKPEVCVNRKLLMSDFDEYGEGCLSKDRKAFIGVFPGGYMGGGNYIFRYDIAEDVFDIAEKLNETTPDGRVWAVPPHEFGKRTGNIIKMTGGGGDAGWVMTANYDYDFVANTVRIMKACWSYDRETPDCKSF